jgi:hypothetical protein
LSEKLRRRASEYKKASANRPTIGEHSKNREKLRSSMDLVEDDEAAKAFEGEHWIGQLIEIPGILQVEVSDLSLSPS